MSIQPIEIARKLEDLLDELNHTENLVNPFFRISKGTPEQLHKYKIINAKFLRLRAVLQLFPGIFMSIFKVAFSIMGSSLFASQYKLFEYQSARGQSLFVSHGIGKNITQKEGDQFFGEIPENLNSHGKGVTIVYTNHNLFGFANNNKLLQSKSNDIARFLIPKFLHPRENLTYLKKINTLARKSLCLGISKLRKEPIESVLLIKACIFFYTRATYTNYLVNQRIQDFLSEGRVHAVLFTFEGHSYEQFVIDETLKKLPNIKIALYQHSPIVKDHFGITTFLKKNKHSLVIFTTGKYYKQLFGEISNKYVIEVLGSNKYDVNRITAISSVTNQLLFVPEGTTYATESLLKLISRMIKEDLNYHYNLRLHPNLKSSIALSWRIKKLQANKNFVISKNLLYDDLALAKFVVYRSSAVGIESLKSSAIPIFYGSQEISGLNVMGHLTNIFPSLHSINQAIDFFKNSSRTFEGFDAQKLFSELFSELDYRKLSLLLSS
jgi:hypothetical protein